MNLRRKHSPVGMRCRASGAGVARRRKLTSALIQTLCLTRRLSKQTVLYPKGIPSYSPGLGGTTYPGKHAQQTSNPNGVAPRSSHNRRSINQSRVSEMTSADTTPLGLNSFSNQFPRVGRASQPWALWRNPLGIEGIYSSRMRLKQCPSQEGNCEMPDAYPRTVALLGAVRGGFSCANQVISCAARAFFLIGRCTATPRTRSSASLPRHGAERQLFGGGR